MVLTEERKAYQKEYKRKNKERIKEQQKQNLKDYYQRKKEEISTYQKQYREKNKEIIKEKEKERYQKNKDKPNPKPKKNIPTKITREYGWKKNSIILNEDTYEKFEEATRCVSCNVKFEKNINNTRKCLDHHHASGHVRNIICSKCNANRRVVDNNIRILLLELHRYFIRLSISF